MSGKDRINVFPSRGCVKFYLTEVVVYMQIVIIVLQLDFTMQSPDFDEKSFEGSSNGTQFVKKES